MLHPTEQSKSSPKRPYPAQLCGKVAIVTGAGRGIGRAIALAFGSAGALVACISRTEAEVQDIANTINNGSGDASVKALPIVYDVTNIDGIPELISDIQSRLGPIDILVNNAGIARIDALECHLDMSVWQQVIATNLSGPVALISSLLPSMLARGSGTIISIGSRNAAFDIPYTSAYSVAKTGLLKFHQNIECEVGGRGVHSYYLQPGNVDTGILATSNAVHRSSVDQLDGLRDMVEQISQRSMIGPEVVAEACLALVTCLDSSLLSGLYIDLDQNVDAILDDLRMGREGRCVQQGLYKLKINCL